MGSESNGGSHSQRAYIGSVMQVPTPTPLPTRRVVVVEPVVRAETSTVKDEFAPVGDGQCVAFVQAHGFSEFSGNAGTWKRYINTKNPRAGDVVVLREGPVGHVALLETVASQSLGLLEQNYEGRYIVSRRTISRNYARIVGFIMRTD